ncbi:MAG: pseudouridine synthase [Prevotellaceae bacterium]|jgi:23S rRNA pseudouridine2605 synthase|nr:pseudouridine synthase [Prevotellaceae bacterium]
MENNQEEPKTYRSRTGSVERKKTSQASPRSAEESPSGGGDEPKPRERKSAAEQPAARPSARQSFFKNRTPQSKPYDESEYDAAPRRAPRTFRSPRKDDDTKPRRNPSGRDAGGRDAGDRPQKSAGFDRFRKEKPRSERRAYDDRQRPDEGRPYARKSYRDEEPRSYRRPSRAYGEQEDTYRRDKPFGDRSRSYAKPQDEKPYARKPYGAKDEKPYARKPYGAKDEKPYVRKPYGAKDEKPYARKPYGAKEDYAPRSSDRPRAAKKPFREIQVKEPNMPVRLNKFIANSGVCSRREADEYIQNGEITVNGEVVTVLGTKVLSTDEIRWNGDKLSGEKRVYLVLNKPKGYVTTVEDPHADKTVMDLIVGACSERVYPVGRLDKNTTGVLLFTNDGELTKTLTHPSYSKRKVYQVTLDKTLKKPDMEQLVAGVELEDGVALADEVGYTNMEDKTEVGLEIHSGRNRVVRRMFEALGYEVKKLDRVYFAGLTKKSLERGKWRLLSPKEISMLKMGAYE